MKTTLATATAADVTLRPGAAADTEALARICFESFTHVNRTHGFAPEFPDEGFARGLIEMVLAHPQVFSVVAERGGRVVGSNFLWETCDIAGVGPISVDVAEQDADLGRRLMEAVLRRADERAFVGVRLVQAAFNARSMALYTKLGFEIREPLVCLNGAPLRRSVPGYKVRAGSERDATACNELCRRVHGHDRRGEVADALRTGTLRVSEHDGRITGYATHLGFFAHAVGESNDDLKALIGAAEAFAGPGFLLPSRNAELFRWCLSQGLRIVQPMSLMSRGLYAEPRGAFLPSVLF